MTFMTNRKTMLDAAKKAYRATGKSLSILGALHMRADVGSGVVRITGTDTETAIRAAVHADVMDSGEAVVEAQLLIGMLAKLRGDDVAFESADTHKVTISAGTAVFELAVMDADGYPTLEIPIPGETVAISGLKRLIESASFAAETGTPGGSARPYLRCVKLALDGRGIRAIASDGFCVAETAGDPEAVGNFSALIPAQSLKTLASISGDKDVHRFGVSAAGKHAVFFDGTALFSTRIIEAEYFDTDTFFGTYRSVISVETEADKLGAAIRNVTALADRLDVLEMSFRESEIYLRCETEHGVGATSFPASVTQHDGTKQLGGVYFFSHKQLTECVKTLDGPITLDVDKNGMLRICHGGTRYIQLPARRAAKADKPAGWKPAGTAGRASDKMEDHADAGDQDAGAA